MNKNYIRILIRLTFLLLLPIMTLNCKKQNSVYSIQDSFKPWVIFQKGSYWVYLNEVNHTIDSTYIDKSPTSFYTPPAPASIQYEEVTFTYSSGFLKKMYVSSGKDVPYCILGDYIDDTRALSARIIDNSSIQVSESCWLVEKIDTVVINNKVFTNVLHTRDTNNHPSSLSVKDFYFMKDVGLIKYSIKTPNIEGTWSLMRWHCIL